MSSWTSRSAAIMSKTSRGVRTTAGRLGTCSLTPPPLVQSSLNTDDVSNGIYMRSTSSLGEDSFDVADERTIEMTVEETRATIDDEVCFFRLVDTIGDH